MKFISLFYFKFLVYWLYRVGNHQEVVQKKEEKDNRTVKERNKVGSHAVRVELFLQFWGFILFVWMDGMVLYVSLTSYDAHALI